MLVVLGDKHTFAQRLRPFGPLLAPPASPEWPSESENMNNITEAEAHARDEAWDRASRVRPYRPGGVYMTSIPLAEWEAMKRQLETALDELKVRTAERDRAEQTLNKVLNRWEAIAQ
jgi:hypothetical protein